MRYAFVLTLLTLIPTLSGGQESIFRGSLSRVPALRWEDAFVSGNGRMGAMLFGAPTDESLVANHCRLFLPLGNREVVPDLAAHVPELRRIIREKNYGEAMGLFLGKAKEQGYPGLIPTDPFHPGFFVNVRQSTVGAITGYERRENFQTGEVVVRWRDARGDFRRRMLRPRTQNLIVISLTGPAMGELDCEMFFPPVSPRGHAEEGGGWTADLGSELIESRQQTSAEWVTYHNTYLKGKGGYDSAIRIITQGGQARAEGNVVKISGATEVLLLARIVPWKTPLPRDKSDARAYSPENPDFAQRAGRFQPVPALAESSVVAYRQDSDAAALMPQLKKSLTEVPTNYEALFEPHAKSHASMFDRVTLDLGGGTDRAKSVEELLDVAKNENRLPAALMEKIYDAGRYMFLCCAGELPPNLQGIWTGTWKPAWSGDFTLDTNLQLALKHGFSGNMPELMEGYYRLIEGFYPEWRLNANRIYGCRGFLTNARASNTALMLHWGNWQGVFWTAGAGWLAHFFHDGWQYGGDREFLALRVVPLLKEVVAFYEDFVVLNPTTGFFEFLPSYSPESSTGITCTMDVMVCKEALTSLLESCRVLGIERENTARWEAMLAKLPPYRINKDGALAEWVTENGEWYRHRHLSHLHALYEATDDLGPEKTPELWRAAQEAVRLRINSDGEQSSHGRMHMGLAAAHLRLAEESYGRLAIMATNHSMFPSMMCAHEPGQRIFNVDANGAMPEIVNRMLLGSRPGRLDVLPALPAAWPKGEIRGILARRQITINRLAWDKPAGTVRLMLTSDAKQTVEIRLGETSRQLDLPMAKSVEVELKW